MDIKEYWARLVASGLAPKEDNICASYNPYRSHYLKIADDNRLLLCANFKNTICEKAIDPIQLRKDGVDLYHLEWRKPTEQDIGKMCWFLVGYDEGGIMLSSLWAVDENNIYGAEANIVTDTSEYCLMASYGQIAPTIKDFKQVYGD